MHYKGEKIKTYRVVCLLLYKGFAQFLPASYRRTGKLAKRIRYCLCRHIFAECGINVNVERKANFGNGFGICIGDGSGIGVNADIPNDTHIGSKVLMGPDVIILPRNHNYDRTDIPIGDQGLGPCRQTIIEDDVWIGRGVTMTPGRHISKGSVIAAECLLCKDFPPYSVVGGNPSRLIKSRINE